MYITEKEVREKISVGECIEVLRRAFSMDFINIPRYRLQSTNSILHVMSASIPGLGVMGLKAYGTSRSGVDFAVLLYEEATGYLLAVLEADALGQIRTGAASGLATDLLARPDARVAALIGTGYQAETQLCALDLVRNLTEIRVFSRSPEKRQEFIGRMQAAVRTPLVEAMSAEECIRNADIISTITSGKEISVKGEWIKQGCHINAAGSNWANKRELDDEAVLRSSVICVDDLEQSKIESGDLIGVVNAADVWLRSVELSDVVRGRAGRTSPDQITLFKSNGIAMEDVATAHHIYLKCKAKTAKVESEH